MKAKKIVSLLNPKNLKILTRWTNPVARFGFCANNYFGNDSTTFMTRPLIEDQYYLPSDLSFSQFSALF